MLNAFFDRRGFSALAAAVALAAGLAWSPAQAASVHRLAPAQAAEVRVANLQTDELEEVFWLCDHAAAVGMIDAAERAICTAVTDELKTEKFGGDFQRLLEWWRANRALEHRRLEGGPNAVH
jgi:hypothetical protein